MGHLTMGIGVSGKLMVKESLLIRLEIYMRGVFSCQWLMEIKEYSLIHLERFMKGNGDLIRNMEKEKRYGPVIILSMKVTILKGIGKERGYLSEMERVSIKESGVRI
jgi:hypothetical protein